MLMEQSIASCIGNPHSLEAILVRILRAAAAQMGRRKKRILESARLAGCWSFWRRLPRAARAWSCFLNWPSPTFFPRWYLEGDALDQYFECSMPNPAVQRLFDRARALRVGFYIGYAEQTADRQRYNCSILVDRDGAILGRYRKVHLPGSVEPRADARFQQISCLSRRTGLVSRRSWV
ncbi:hypothetical protein ACVWY2_000236 [Bradyrhizobium sp. JR6.1]